MSRPNWINFAMYAIPIVCVVIAFSIGFYNFTHLKQSETDLLDVQNHLRTDKLQLTSSQQDLEKVQREPQLTAAITPLEAIEFSHVLPQLAALSGVKLSRMSTKNLEKLDPITPPPPPAPPPPGSNVPPKPPPPPYSIGNLPLGAIAISSDVTVRGRYINVHNFIWRLNNFRYSVRAININSIMINDWNERTQMVSAEMTLTRFVRPATAPPGNTISAPGTPGAPGATSATGTTPSSAVGNDPQAKGAFKGIKPADPGALLHPGGR